MEWLVTVCVPGASAMDSGPGVLVEADDVSGALHAGLASLIENDTSYGVQCSHCEGVAIEDLAVFPAAAAIVYERGDSVWSRKTPVDG